MAIVNGDSRNNIVNYLAYSKITAHCLYSPSQVQDPQDWQKLHLTDTGEKFKCVVESIIVVVYFRSRDLMGPPVTTTTLPSSNMCVMC